MMKQAEVSGKGRTQLFSKRNDVEEQMKKIDEDIKGEVKIENKKGFGQNNNVIIQGLNQELLPRKKIQPPQANFFREVLL